MVRSGIGQAHGERVHQVREKDDRSVDEGRPDEGQGQGQKSDDGLPGQDSRPDRPARPVQRRTTRYANGNNHRITLTATQRRGVSDFQPGDRAIGTRAGYWGKRAIAAKLGINGTTFRNWRRNWGFPIWERWDWKIGRMTAWTDDDMILSWKLKMAEMDRARRYTATPGRRKRTVQT